VDVAAAFVARINAHDVAALGELRPTTTCSSTASTTRRPGARPCRPGGRSTSPWSRLLGQVRDGAARGTHGSPSSARPAGPTPRHGRWPGRPVGGTGAWLAQVRDWARGEVARVSRQPAAAAADGPRGEVRIVTRVPPTHRHGNRRPFRHTHRREAAQLRLRRRPPRRCRRPAPSGRTRVAAGEGGDVGAAARGRSGRTRGAPATGRPASRHHPRLG